jgi:hypothetical protein
VASHSSVQSNVFQTSLHEAHASGSATAELKSADGKKTTPHCAAPPRTRKARKPKLVDDAFITELKRLNPDKDVDKEAQMARTWILAKPDRQFTQQFLAGWINRSTNTIKPERFSNF